MTTSLRKLLISRGAIRPLAARKTLRLDYRGRAAADRHIAEYEACPERFSENRFWFDLEAWMFPEVEDGLG